MIYVQNYFFKLLIPILNISLRSIRVVSRGLCSLRAPSPAGLEGVVRDAPAEREQVRPAVQPRRRARKLRPAPGSRSLGQTALQLRRRL